MAPSEGGSDCDVDFLSGNCALALARPGLSDDIRVQTASYRPPVPNELWCKIWQLLALEDRLAVARVCSEWLHLAHADRSLWNHLDFRTSIHQRNCLCKVCNILDYASDSSDPDAEGWPWNVSNLHHAAQVLPLSGNLNLHITLEVQARDASLDELYTLGVTLALHANRIATLSIRTADTAAYYTFLARIESLPALRSFSGVLMGNHGRRPCGASFVPAALQVPELQTVRLSKGFCFPTPQIGHTFPNIRDISIAPAMSVSAEVSQALGACPNLDAFALDLHAFARSAPSEDTAAAIQRRASALRSLTVSGIRLEFEQWVLAALSHPALQTLTLEYDSPHDISLGWTIFASLSGPVTLRMSIKTHWPECDYPTSDSVFSMQIEDAHRRTRRIALHHCALGEAQLALVHLAGTPPRRIVAPYALWPLVRGALGLRALDTVTLVVSAYDLKEQNISVASDYSAETDNEDVPLRSLTLIYDGPGTLSLSAAQVEQLVRHARVRLPLEVLTLDRRLAASVPDGLARTVVITSCTIPDFPMPAPLRDEQRCESEPESDESDLDESD